MRDGKQLEGLRAATKVLASSGDFWFAVVESSIDGILVSDKFGQITYANPPAHLIFGYCPNELIGENISILVGGGHNTKHSGYILKYRETGISDIIGKLSKGVAAKTKDGTEINICLSISEVKNGAHYFVAHVRMDDDGQR